MYKHNLKKTAKLIVEKANELAKNDFALMSYADMDIIDCIAYCVSEQLDIESSKVYDFLMEFKNINYD
tara:strand:- start:1946 stop:2149 length:204 start_codon:yes stop_codon:yes gene_type:complete